MLSEEGMQHADQRAFTSVSNRVSGMLVFIVSVNEKEGWIRIRIANCSLLIGTKQLRIQDIRWGAPTRCWEGEALTSNAGTVQWKRVLK